MSQPLHRYLQKEVAPTEEPTKELTPAEASTEETAPTEEPTKEELAVLMAMVSGAAEEQDNSPVLQKEKEKGEVPHRNFPGWMEVLHPT